MVTAPRSGSRALAGGNPATAASVTDTVPGLEAAPGERRTSVCRICEANCGIVVTVDGGRVTKIQGGPDHPSRGYLCPKGANFGFVQEDPDRVRTPLRRVGGPGEFEPCTWDEALNDIAARLKAIIAERGSDSVGVYFGNPAAYDTGHLLWLLSLARTLGTPHVYSPGSQDTNTRLVASHHLYGRTGVVPFPDIDRTSFVLMLGANPVVSHGSMWGVPRIREALQDVVGRGGRVVVIDPRRTETARLFEHVAVRADSDPWLLLSLLHVIFAEHIEDAAFVATRTSGADELRRLVMPFTPERTERETGVAAGVVVQLARDFAAADGAAAYGRTGACTNSFGTLVCFLLDCLNAVTGNLDVPGGAVFGTPPVNAKLAAKFVLPSSYGAKRSRVGGYPDVAAMMPSAIMPREIMTPGPGQLRALIVGAGNPLISTPDEASVEGALQTLDLLVCVDLYVSDTGKYAHYVLPDVTFLERDDVDLVHMSYLAQPFIQATRKVVDPPPEARRACDIYDDIARRIGLGSCFENPWLRRLQRLGIRLTTRRLVDLLIRTGPRGGWFGLRRRDLTLRKLERKAHGLVLAEHVETGTLARKIGHADGRVHLCAPEIVSEVARLIAFQRDERFPLRLIGMRETRSQNSWMHNVPKLVKSRTAAELRIHPMDAAAAGIGAGSQARISSATGSVIVTVKITDEIVRGTVALPHGWGHRGGWTTATACGGANSNVLASSRDDDVEPLAGMTRLNGISVRVEPA